MIVYLIKQLHYYFPIQVILLVFVELIVAKYVYDKNLIKFEFINGKSSLVFENFI